jgi:flagellar biosynthesis activator protein FlaF
MTGYAAYGKVQNVTENPRSTERRLLSQVTAALIDAGKSAENVQKLYDAILWNKRVWDTFAYEAAADDNQLPKEIRAGIISLAIWVNKETTMIMDGQTDLEPLISVNKSIIEGLK